MIYLSYLTILQSFPQSNKHIQFSIKAIWPGCDLEIWTRSLTMLWTCTAQWAISSCKVFIRITFMVSDKTATLVLAPCRMPLLIITYTHIFPATQKRASLNTFPACFNFLNFQFQSSHCAWFFHSNHLYRLDQQSVWESEGLGTILWWFNRL